ncbi:MAG: hypothetical protein HQL99_14140 [Magnetococcales bacterium]|nr:hypothetical protein [Magnetococcales bacterium]
MHHTQEPAVVKPCDTLKVYRNGVLIDQIDDLVTNVGFAWIAQRMKGQGGPITHMAIGSDSTAANLNDTALGAELARVPITTSGGVVTGDSIVFMGQFPAGVGIGTVHEVGIFDASTGGNLVARNVKGPYAKAAEDDLAFVLTIRIGQE